MSEHETEQRPRRAPALILIGLIALGVSGWGLSGGTSLPDSISPVWVLVGLAVVVGVGLIVLGARSGSSGD
ncbi:hypothetical protein GOEFS_094_00300 [Gordonia effusa NBRC 100432]|uniref:Uncharacterized protein n=1 Tax=Gordonia effusa NBRC 100432 TaxID=1077974 RepID=H0R3T0_9ACTN|nr:hypothetical protein [Gordonia effusa]GAB19731.1 hypothetical protein GOEFS_094_00300 [Gordonia effusa NBRC 100432]